LARATIAASPLPWIRAREAPANATVTAQLDCSGVVAPASGAGDGSTAGWLCAAVVYDGATNATLLFAGLVSRGGAVRVEALAPGFAPAAFGLDGVVLAAAATQADGSSPWPAAAALFFFRSTLPTARSRLIVPALVSTATPAES
jgi:hypothetical protein